MTKQSDATGALPEEADASSEEVLAPLEVPSPLHLRYIYPGHDQVHDQDPVQEKVMNANTSLRIGLKLSEAKDVTVLWVSESSTAAVGQ